MRAYNWGPTVWGATAAAVETIMGAYSRPTGSVGACSGSQQWRSLVGADSGSLQWEPTMGAYSGSLQWGPTVWEPPGGPSWRAYTRPNTYVFL